MTLTYLTSRSSLLLNAFKWDFFLKDDFLKTVEAKVIIKVTTHSNNRNSKSLREVILGSVRL